MKFALISHVLPPSQSGQAVMLYRLLRRLSPEDYCVVRPYSPGYAGKRGEYSEQLPSAHYELPQEWYIERGHRWGLRKLRCMFNRWFGMLSRAWRIARIVRREECSQIVACTGDLLGPPAAFLASYLTGAEFYLYVFDYYSYQWTDPVDRAFATRMEARMMRRANGIIAANEVMGEDLRERYGANVLVIHNSCELAEFTPALTDDVVRTPVGSIRISYTGAVYEAQRDAMLNLVSALDMLDDSRIELHIYTKMELFKPGEEPTAARVVFHDHQSLATSRLTQQESDILFLPLGFQTAYPEVIRTSAPVKMGEYLASGRPILVHAPADSFVSRYFRQHDCGLVVDQPQPELLALAIRRLTDDGELRRQLAERAQDCAQSDFNAEKSASELATFLQAELLHSAT